MGVEGGADTAGEAAGRIEKLSKKEREEMEVMRAAAEKEIERMREERKQVIEARKAENRSKSSLGDGSGGDGKDDWQKIAEFINERKEHNPETQRMRELLTQC